MMQHHPMLRLGILLLSLLSSAACNKQAPPSGPADPCEKHVAHWAALLKTVTSSSVATRIAHIQTAALQMGEDTAGCTNDLISAALDGELRNVVLLNVGAQKYSPVVVYTCDRLSEVTQCSGREADGTAQLHEARDLALALPANATAQIQTITDYSITSLQWYQALDRALLDDAQAVAAATLTADGSLRLPPATQANVIFAIGRGDGGKFHKWVWLLGN